MKTVGILGSGPVGESLADGFLKNGYTVIRGTRDPAKLQEWTKKAGPKALIASVGEAVAKSDLVVLAVKGSAAEEAVKGVAGALKGKVVIDATNPTLDEKPDNGVLRYYTDINMSLMERLQKLSPDAKFVKAFNYVGYAHFMNPKFGAKPSMFICGSDAEAKKQVSEIVTLFGWETEDMGPIEAARAIEPLAMLWCIPMITQGSIGHALKMLHQ